jgi:LSM domain
MVIKMLNPAIVPSSPLSVTVLYIMDADTILSHVPFTTSGSLVDCVDKKVIIILRDGKEHIGVLRSYDQFANLLIENPQQKCFDLVRGENVVMMGEIVRLLTQKKEFNF